MATVLDSVRAFFAQAVFTIDQENAGDIVARERLLDRVMGEARFRKSSEKIRRGRLPAEGLALVARDPHGHVIGTVRLWNIEAGVDADGNAVSALLLGPLAVDCAHEGKGIGGALMRAALTEARDLGHGAVLLVGDPEYYERFGFFADKAQHLVMPGPFERRRFLALELREGWLSGAAGVLVASGRRLVSDQRKAA
ncbi:N-acetyltransferase [Shinella curvata]|uniref:N-acetyltransferase n=1 Tax=Shinella curvata TaxID=1817964 RepID=A0ABT8XDZ9_9HYPH|nr:N-acetyltransferase [Shinella curvata]MCJ8055558.1 N-acetyltransferase [Shinella curvata]MDO6121975.1 N-acetyltransferase [Shinella curvata]